MATVKYEFESFQYGATDLSDLLDAAWQRADDYIHTYYRMVAGEALSAYKAVYMDTSKELKHCAADGTQVCIGITIESASASAYVRAQRIGEISNSNWSWTPGATIYVDSTAGELTEVQPTYPQMVGIASDSTSILLLIDTTERDKVLDSLKLVGASKTFGDDSIADVATTAETLTSDSTGTVSNTIQNVNGSGADDEVNDNFASLTDEVNKLRTDNENQKAKINEIITALEDVGILT